MASSNIALSAEPSSPMEIRRASSLQPAGRQARSISFGPNSVPRRQSAQERINDILETARHRADTISMHGSPSMHSPMMAPERAPQLPEDTGEPDETTGIVTARNTRDYQSTQTTSSLRNRQQSSRTESNHAGQNGSTAHHAGEKNWLMASLGGVWSIELENKGSVARDHLALERTFLAWLRTSLAFASIGIGITQLFRLNTSISGQGDLHFVAVRHLGRPLGATFIGISILVLFLGYHRYYQSQQWVLKGKFPASRGTIILVSFVAFALMLVSLIVVVFIQPSGGGSN
ncbi:hypothetical protein F5Y19DRAFT_367657 [Xylariaceae sp. FL1651]|nr:hypothetical protein F5Y19DRAFT_367657 [Xylariaceae sp. FL1651]